MKVKLNTRQTFALNHTRERPKEAKVRYSQTPMRFSLSKANIPGKQSKWQDTTKVAMAYNQQIPELFVGNEFEQKNVLNEG